MIIAKFWPPKSDSAKENGIIATGKVEIPCDLILSENCFFLMKKRDRSKDKSDNGPVWMLELCRSTDKQERSGNNGNDEFPES